MRVLISALVLAVSSANAQESFDRAPFLVDIAHYGASCAGYALAYAKYQEDRDGIDDVQGDLVDLAAESRVPLADLVAQADAHAARYLPAFAVVLPEGQGAGSRFPDEVQVLRMGQSDCQEADRSRLLLIDAEARWQASQE